MVIPENRMPLVISIVVVVMHVTMAIQENRVSMVMTSATKVEMKVVMHVTMANQGDRVSVVMNSATKMDTTVNNQTHVVIHVAMAIPRDGIS